MCLLVFIRGFLVLTIFEKTKPIYSYRVLRAEFSVWSPKDGEIEVEKIKPILYGSNERNCIYNKG